MRSIRVLVFLLLALTLAPGAWGQDKDWTFHLGLGGNYGLESLDLDELNAELRPLGFSSMSVDNAIGLNAKAGFMYQRMIGGEFNFDYFSNFEGTSRADIAGTPVELKMDLEVKTYLFDVKFAPDFGLDSARPYLFAGIGWMQANIKATGSGGGTFQQNSDDDSDTAAEFGLGLDYYFSDRFSLGGEAAYVMGFGDMEEIKYVNITLGAAFHF